MPRSKRFQKKSLTQTNKKGLALKQRLIEQIRSCAEKYDRIFTFSVKNMRNIHLKDVRGKMADSRFFFGKNKVMVLALGKAPEDEHLGGLHQLASHIHGQTGLLFTNKKKAHVTKFFGEYRVADYARSGDVATETVVLEAGPVKMDLCHSMEPQLRQLGLPTSLVRGVITLTQEYEVCKKGDKITPEKGRILKLFGYQMAEFSIRPTGMWTKEAGTWESFGRSKTDDAENMDTDEEEDDDEEEEEEEDDIGDT